jgi:hypothetical protein
MSDNQIEAYLEKYKIVNRELLENHLEEIQRNTVVNKDIVFTLTELLCDEELFFRFFRAKKENKNIGSPFFLDEVLTYDFKKAKQQTEEEIIEILNTILNPNLKVNERVRDEWASNDTGSTVFEKLQDTPIYPYSIKGQIELIKESSNKIKNRQIISDLYFQPMKRGKIFTYNTESNVGKKEIENKIDYSEINLELIDLMAKRFSENKEKYPKGNMKKYIEKDSLLWAAYRHLRKMIQPIENDSETYEEHLAAVSCNMSMVLDQLKNK